MRIGILSDTHDQIPITRAAVDLLRAEGARMLVHCGDIIGPEIVRECSALPLYFTFGNHDSDMVPYLERAAAENRAQCLGWGGEFSVAKKRIAVVHGHLTMDLRPLLAAGPDYLLSGHSHIPRDWREGKTHRINPGSLYEADVLTVAVLDLDKDHVSFHAIPDRG